jgi:hypothetical protein
MARFPSRLVTTPFAPDDRLAGAALTLLIHLVLILAWQMASRLPQAQQEGSESAMQWLLLPTPAPRIEAESAPVHAPAPDHPGRHPAPAARRAASTDAMTTPLTPDAAMSPLPAAPELPASPVGDSERAALPDAAAMLENARRNVGAIDRALRKENRPLIVAPPDSAQIRLRRGIEHAREMAPPRLWEAPKVVEMVNNTGDGARRTRVITGRRTYCITERAPTTNIEMIEMHGKQRFTNCPTHEEPPKAQEWRTARD